MIILSVTISLLVEALATYAPGNKLEVENVVIPSALQVIFSIATPFMV